MGRGICGDVSWGACFICHGALILVRRRCSGREEEREEVLGTDGASATSSQGRALTKFYRDRLETHVRNCRIASFGRPFYALGGGVAVLHESFIEFS